MDTVRTLFQVNWPSELSHCVMPCGTTSVVLLDCRMRFSSVDKSSRRHELFFISSDTISDIDRSKLAASFSDEIRWHILPFSSTPGVIILRTQFPSGSTLLHFKKIITEAADATAHSVCYAMLNLQIDSR